MGSGLIYVVILGLWAAYLLPKLLRRGDDRLLDRPSVGVRVLSRRSRGTVDGGGTESAVSAGVAETHPRSRAEKSRRRLMARRRRTVLLLLAAALAGAVTWGFGLAPWWVPAAIAVLATTHLLHLRIQARHAAELRRRRAATAQRVARRARRLDDRSLAPRQAGEHETARRDEQAQPATADPAEGALLPTPARAAPVPAFPPTQPGDAWEPIPVTLPTYVTKPKASRPVRVIDLSRPGAWTADVAAPTVVVSPSPSPTPTSPPAEAPAASDGEAEGQRHAVNE